MTTQTETQIEVLHHTGVRESYTRIRHKSGMTICVLPKKTAVTCAMLGVRCGAVDREFDVDGKRYTAAAGCAHFLEHKLFAQENGEDAMTRFAACGANADAYTTPDVTVYLFSAVENEGEALSILLDFVLHPYFTKENVERERSIIAQEIRMYDDSPPQRAYYQTLEAMYHTHPIRDNVGGTEASIAEITPEMLYRFYRAFYHPANMVLTVAGRLTAEEVLAICDAALSDTFPPFDTKRIFPAEPDAVRMPYVESESDTALPLLCIGIKDTEMPFDRTERERRAAAIDILCDILFCKSSQLYQELYDANLIRGRFDYEYENAETYAYVMLTAETRDPAAAEAKIRQYLSDRIARHDIPDDAFERCRRVMYASAVTAFESAEDIAAECLNDALDAGELFASIDIMTVVAKEELFCLLDTLFAPEHIVTSVLQKKESDDGE